MTSALRYNAGEAFQVGVQLHDRQQERIRRQAMSPRQLELNRLWSFYSCEQYDARSTTWDGRPALSPIERDMIAHTQVLPPGFWDPGGKFDEIPLAMRKPTAPYHLTRVVTNRFTGLLFADSKHPHVQIAGDLAPEVRNQIGDWIEGLIKACRMWIRMAYARTFGGSMGAVCATFRFKAGRPVIEVHDPRWCTPTITDPSTGEISALEIRYIYQVEVYDQKGCLDTVDYWYRRTIDAKSDVRYNPAPVGEGDEPQWTEAERVDHNLGEFPGVWIRNSQTDQQDGEPDCHGLFDTQEAIDRLLSQADQGAVENCDPTLVVTSDELKTEALRKGSRNAIKLEKGGTASYAEITGSGIDGALKVCAEHRRNFLEVAQCILESESSSGAITATEINRRYSSMHERGSLFREQYGEMGVKPLLGKMVRAAIKLNLGAVDATNTIVVQTIALPPRENQDGSFTQRQLPRGITQITDDQIELRWPEWTKLGPSDASAAAGAVATARSAQALDQESAVSYLAPYFNIDNPADAVAKLMGEGGAADDAMMKDLIAASGVPAAPTPGQPTLPTPAATVPPPAPAPVAPPTDPAAAPGSVPAPAPAKPREPLNGAQVQSMLLIMGQVNTNTITRPQGIAALKQAFLWTDEEAASVIGPEPAPGTPPITPPPPPGPPGGFHGHGGGGFPP